MSGIVFQPLKTLGGCYIYDRSVDRFPVGVCMGLILAL